MYRNRDSKKFYQTAKAKPFTLGNGVHKASVFQVATVFAVAFFVAFVAASACAPVDNSSAADSSSASTTVSLDLPPSISIESSTNNVTLGITADKLNTLVTSDFSIAVSTNNPTGYSLTLATDSSATDGATITTTDPGTGNSATETNVATNALVNTSNNKFYVPSITSTIDLSSDPTGATFPVNSWAYGIGTATKDTGTGAISITKATTYNPLPAAGSSTTIFSKTDGAYEDDLTGITVGAKVDLDTPAGNYTNTIVLTAVTNFNQEYDTYTISYDANGGTGTMNNTHTNVKEGDSLMLVAPNFRRTGYGFVGWSFNKDATPGGSSTIYGPNESIAAPYLSNEENQHKTLYAIWKASEGNMQSWDKCGTMSVGDVTALTDTRDGNTYAVAKLADQKCWQVENLRLSSGTIDSTTTNNPASDFALGSASTSWCTSANATCYDQSVWNNANSTNYYSYGNYYNWFSATAGNGKYATSSVDVSGDICPFGWHLPTSTDNGEFQAMYSAAGSSSAAIRKSPYNFVLSGRWYGSGVGNRGSYGDYSSSTARNTIGAYYLLLGRSSVRPTYEGYKYDGRSIRCVTGQSSTH